jgi:mannose-6-phosphate isomerase
VALNFLLTGENGVDELVAQCVTVANETREPSAEAVTVCELDREYPGDPGIVLALLLNRVSLNRGEALFLPAGNMHAYLSGLGVELMAASDNVLRGGLTRKHIDVAELVTVTQCQPLAIPRLVPQELARGIRGFAPDGCDFSLLQITLEEAENGGHAEMNFDGPAILICTNGEISCAGKQSSEVVQRGDFFFLTPDESVVEFTGSGEIFVARQGLNPV